MSNIGRPFQVELKAAAQRVAVQFDVNRLDDPRVVVNHRRLQLGRDSSRGRIGAVAFEQPGLLIVHARLWPGAVNFSLQRQFASRRGRAAQITMAALFTGLISNARPSVGQRREPTGERQSRQIVGVDAKKVNSGLVVSFYIGAQIHLDQRRKPRHARQADRSDLQPEENETDPGIGHARIDRQLARHMRS
jgi:hypothetical protein